MSHDADTSTTTSAPTSASTSKSATASASASASVSVSVSVSVNGERRSLAPGTALDALVATVTRVRSGVAAAVNETVVPRDRWPLTALSDGDRVEILTAVQGG